MKIRLPNKETVNDIARAVLCPPVLLLFLLPMPFGIFTTFYMALVEQNTLAACLAVFFVLCLVGLLVRYTMDEVKRSREKREFQQYQLVFYFEHILRVLRIDVRPRGGWGCGG